jgi:hypothetical protein
MKQMAMDRNTSELNPLGSKIPLSAEIDGEMELNDFMCYFNNTLLPDKIIKR